MVTLAAVDAVVHENLRLAEKAISGIVLREALAKSMLADVPRFSRLRLGYGAGAWAVILFVDMRHSTTIAKDLGPKRMYLAIHAFLPTMVYLVQQQHGYIVGFRGDGLFAAFGLGLDGSNPDDLDKAHVVCDASLCGERMIEAVQRAVNPALREYKIFRELSIGVGIDAGEIIVTRVGLDDAYEITAYGDAVNFASKLSSRENVVCLSHTVHRLFPRSPEGEVIITPVDDGTSVAQYPYYTLV